jgi:hemerythrin superfamily protein
MRALARLLLLPCDMSDGKPDDRQPGLRMRIVREARRISGQHRQLDVFYGMLIKSLFRENVAKARAEFLRFHDALEAHFTVEERIHFPALHGLRPELDAELAALVEEHKAFRETLDRLAALLESKELARCSDDLDQFVVELAAHEGREEQMAERVAGDGG